MPYNYHGLSLFTLSDIVDDKKIEAHYKCLSGKMPEVELKKIRPFHQGAFQLSGTNHFMPDFIVSEEAKQTLSYPQGFLIMEADSSYYTDRKNLDSYEISFTLEGKGFLEYRGMKYQLEKGEGYFISCKEHHLYGTATEKWSRTIFHLNGSLVETLFSKYSSDRNVKFTLNSFPNFEMLQLQVLKASQKIMPYREYRVSCLIDLLLTELLTANNATAFPASTQNVIAAIIQHLRDYYNQDITLTDLAHDFGINRTNLCKEFKNYTGFSIKQYVLTLRINHAKLFLRNSNYRVEEISELIGFHDTAHFIQIFKKMIGLTPHQFRNQI
ncbi:MULTISPECIES: AraC family transcriptional regulator [Clostridia]|uniref:AraC family transcriptional regulator n=1 Tax=Clostridia TaxID=186801 RepID=UPI00067E66B6|nr:MULTISPECIES: AraC family transcriptional regulator [Clostridia]